MKMTELEEFNDETENAPQLFTTGAFISPRKFIVDGEPIWLWAVDMFEGGNSYYEGATCNPSENSETKKGLFAEVQED